MPTASIAMPGDQGWQVLCFYETDGLGGETDIKSIMYISSDINPSRCRDGEAVVALRMWNSRVILARASWKPPRKWCACWCGWSMTDHWRAEEVTQGDPGDVVKEHMVPGLAGHTRSLHSIPRTVGSLMELQLWLGHSLYSQEATSQVGKKRYWSN